MIDRILYRSVFILLFLILGCSAPCTFGRTAPKLPGRVVPSRTLPVAMQRFVVRHFSGLGHFTYRSDRRYYYAYDESGGYFLFSERGDMLGFRFYMRQPTRQILALLPEGITDYLREHYRNCFVSTFLPDDEGYRVGLYGETACTLRFDGEGCFLSEE